MNFSLVKMNISAVPSPVLGTRKPGQIMLGSGPEGLQCLSGETDR